MAKKQPPNPDQGLLFDRQALDAGGLAQLPVLRTQVQKCTKCILHKTRNLAVFGEGSSDPKLVIVGEAPGEHEDASGRPFIGRSGYLLERMLRWIRLRRTEVWITNALACRPPFNQPPEPKQIKACRDHVQAQLRAVKAKVILCLGKTATQSLLNVNSAVTSLRGRWHRWEDAAVRVSFHPAFLLRPDGEGYLDEAKVDWRVVERVLRGEEKLPWQ